MTSSKPISDRWWFHVYDLRTGNYVHTRAFGATGAELLQAMGYVLVRASSAEAD